jgi:hypothetical protein
MGGPSISRCEDQQGQHTFRLDEYLRRQIIPADFLLVDKIGYHI